MMQRKISYGTKKEKETQESYPLTIFSKNISISIFD